MRGGNGLKRKPEDIVREYRDAQTAWNELTRGRETRLRASRVEVAIKVFMWVALGWAIGYAHHFMATAR